MPSRSTPPEGTADLAQKHVVVAGSGTGMGGALSSLAGKVIGAEAEVMVAAVAQIEQTGLTLEQIKNIGGGLLSYIKDVDPALAKEIGDTFRVCANTSPNGRKRAMARIRKGLSRLQPTLATGTSGQLVVDPKAVATTIMRRQ